MGGFQIILSMLLSLFGFDVFIPINIDLSIENLSLDGHSTNITIVTGTFGENISLPANLGIIIENEKDTSIFLDKLTLVFPDFAFLGFGNPLEFSIDDLLLNEGRLNILVPLWERHMGIIISEATALETCNFILLEIPNYFKSVVSINTPLEYFQLEMNNEFNNCDPPFNSYILCDTHNTSVSVDTYSYVKKEYINAWVDVINNATNLTLPYVEKDFGLRVDNVSIRADEFKFYLNESANPKISGYLNLSGNGSIYILVNGTWEPLLPGGDGFSIVIVPGHIQIKFDMNVTDLPIYFEANLADNKKLVLSGNFSVYAENLIIDIWFDNKSLEITTNIDKGLDIEDFSFEIFNRSDINDKSIDAKFDLFSIRKGNYSLILNAEEKLIDLEIEGKNVTLQGLYCALRNLTLNLGYLNLTDGAISMKTVNESGNNQWNIKTIKQIKYIELEGFNFSMDNIEGGASSITWDKNTNIDIGASFDFNNGSGYIDIKRDVDRNTTLEITGAYLRILRPNGKYFGGRLRSFTADYQRTGHEYMHVEWKQGEYLDIDADFASSWELTFDRFLTFGDLFGIIDIIGGSIDGNFSAHYVPPNDNDSYHFINLTIHEESTFELLEITNIVAFIFERTLSIASLNVQPGEMTIAGKLNENKDGGWIFIDNKGVTATFEGLTYKRGMEEFTFLDVSFEPGTFYLEIDNTTETLYIDNTATAEFTLFSFSRGIDLLKIEKALEIGVVTMLPGEFKLEWEDLTNGDYDAEFRINNGILEFALLKIRYGIGNYDKEYKIKNGVFEFTLLKISHTVGNYELSFLIGDTDRDYNNDILVKIRLRGSKDRAIYIDTTNPVQFDALAIEVSTPNWSLKIDFLELTADFDEFFIGFFDGNFSYGGKVNLGINRFFNLTFIWKDEGDQEQELFLQYQNAYDGNPQSQALLLDTTNCTEPLDIDFATEMGGLDVEGQLTINEQKYMLIHFDINLSEHDGARDGHFFIDTNDTEMVTLDITISRYFAILDAVVGINVDINPLKADNFYIFGEFTYIGGIWIPTDWELSGSIDPISVGKISFIYDSQFIEIWPCKPIAVLDKTEYGVTTLHPSVTFDTSQSQGFYSFPIRKMRWDFDDDGDWDTGWINYDEEYTHNFTGFLNSGQQSVQIAFQIKTVFLFSEITYATVVKANDFEIEVLYEGEKLFEFEQFNVSVIDYDTQQPISGATVQYISYDDLGNPTIEDINTTDLDGIASFTAIEVPLDDGDHYITCIAHVEKDGYLAADSDYFRVRDTIVDLHGILYDLVTWELVHDALITAEPGGYYCHTPPSPVAGPFHLYVPPGTYTITAYKAGYITTVLFEDFVVEEGTTHVNLDFLYLPPTDYGGINGIVYDALTGDRMWGAKATVELPGEDDLVSYTGISGYFPTWPYYDYHSFKLDPGAYTVTVTYDNYYTYSQEVEVTAGQVTNLQVYLDKEWVSPDDYNDPSSKWKYETKAYDNDESTRAESNKLGPLQGWQWSGYLELTGPTINCDKIRFYAFYHVDYCNKIDVDVYYNGAWHNVYEGAFADNDWVEKNLGGTYSVEKARVRFWYKGFLTGTTADVYEFDFHQVI